MIVVKSSTSEPTIHAQRLADHASEGRSILSDCIPGADSLRKSWESNPLIWRYLAEEIVKSNQDEYSVDPNDRKYDLMIWIFLASFAVIVPLALTTTVYYLYN